PRGVLLEPSVELSNRDELLSATPDPAQVRGDVLGEVVLGNTERRGGVGHRQRQSRNRGLGATWPLGRRHRRPLPFEIRPSLEAAARSRRRAHFTHMRRWSSSSYSGTGPESGNLSPWHGSK